MEQNKLHVASRLVAKMFQSHPTPHPQNNNNKLYTQARMSPSSSVSFCFVLTTV